jgi:transposase
MRLPRFLKFEKYEVTDLKEFLTDNRIEVHLKRNLEPSVCSKCRNHLGHERGHYLVKVEAMSIMGFRTFICFKRYKRHCDYCNKARTEYLEWVSELTPHLTAEFAWWCGRICEIASVNRVAELVSHDKSTTWRLDYNRMIAMLTHYKIQPPIRLSVDEVYARKHSKYFGESREKRYFTIITDSISRKVIWVSEGRSKASLDEFYKMIGAEACSKIEVVAMDQFEGFRSSTEEYCPNATIVLDRFHIIKNFEEVLNETRKYLHQLLPTNDPIKRKTRSSNKFNFMKRADRRTDAEARSIKEVMDQNEDFMMLEIIKERMLSMFNEVDATKALFIWTEIGDWVKYPKFFELKRWYDTLNADWKCVANFFKYRVTTGISEGINNVIKTLKRKAYGYRNMGYFKLKIMQVCGYLNSRYMPSPEFNHLH